MPGERSRQQTLPEESCVSCGATSFDLVLDLKSVPVNCSALCADQSSAIAATRADMRLVCCRRCGLVFNCTFDPGLIEYGVNYDNALDFSPSFREYSEGLAERLVGSYGLYRKRIVEIGSGNGRFLKRLCERGSNDGIGFDPSHPAESGPAGAGAITLVPSYFEGDFGGRRPDLICFRHVLEHIQRPAEFLHELRQMLDHAQPVVYCEVPNAAAVFRGSWMWDVIYPHVSYFAEPTLRWLVESAGFKTLTSGSTYEDQFLYIEAIPGSQATSEPPTAETTRSLVSGFRTRFNDALRSWRNYLAGAFEDSGNIALWGCGAKAITFLNVVPGADRIPFVSDINPHKHNTYVPGTGQKIVDPDVLKHNNIREVIVLNPVYKQEVAGSLHKLGIRAEVVTLPGVPVRK